MLVLTRKEDEALILTWNGQEIRLVVVEIRGAKVRLGIQAPTEIGIVREELAFERPTEVNTEQSITRPLPDFVTGRNSPTS